MGPFRPVPAYLKSHTCGYTTFVGRVMASCTFQKRSGSVQVRDRAKLWLQASGHPYRRAFRLRRDRRPQLRSLLELAVSALARDLHTYDLNEIPADLAQLVLDELLLLRKLDEAVLTLFARQHVYCADFSEYPGVADAWFKHLARSPLRRLSLASCTEVGLLRLQPPSRYPSGVS